jgi:hypothetical protein
MGPSHFFYWSSNKRMPPFKYVNRGCFLYPMVNNCFECSKNGCECGEFEGHLPRHEPAAIAPMGSTRLAGSLTSDGNNFLMIAAGVAASYALCAVVRSAEAARRFVPRTPGTTLPLAALARRRASRTCRSRKPGAVYQGKYAVIRLDFRGF